MWICSGCSQDRLRSGPPGLFDRGEGSLQPPLLISDENRTPCAEGPRVWEVASSVSAFPSLAGFPLKYVANMRSKFIKIRSRWLNSFQSAVLYHSRRRQSNIMTSSKGASKQSAASPARCHLCLFLAPSHSFLIGPRVSCVFFCRHASQNCLALTLTRCTATLPPPSSIKHVFCNIS